jgi:cysteine synthase A
MYNCSKQLKIIENLEKLFGHTPLIELSFRYKSQLKKIFAKYEAFNFSGSIKDRIALHILKKSYQLNLLKEGDIIVEATSGNTGIAFSALGRALGHPVKIFMPDWLSKERYDTIELYGAEVIKISKEQGGFLRSISEAENFVAHHKNQEILAFCPEQFSNQFNAEAHKLYTAQELFHDLQKINQKITHFVAGVGTGGTIMGFHQFCKENNLAVSCHPLEPLNSPTLSTGGKKIGMHRIQGISDEFIPEILKLDQIGKIVSVDDSDAIIMAQKLNQAGLSVGISSGANFIGALKLLLENSENSAVATIFCDSALKYLSTDLCREQKISLDFLSPDIVIENIIVHR